MMPYESLYTLKYKAPQDYAAVYRARFAHHDTIHLKLSIHESPAFICQSAELLSKIIAIHKADKRIRALRGELPGVAIQQFTDRCLVDEIVLTNDIEGVNSTRREIRAVLETLGQNKINLRFYGLVMKYRMLSRSSDIQLNSCQDIRSIYDDLVLREVVAENASDAPDGRLFRKHSVSVTNAAQKEIHRGLLPESAIEDAMQAVLDFIRDDAIDLLIRTAAAHYLIGYIHPFYNGNGRLSRFISSFLLTQELDPLISYRLSYTIKENLKHYDDAFKLCNDPRNCGDLTPFVLWFLDIVLEAINKLEAALAERKQDLERYGALLAADPRFATKKLYKISYYLVQASLFSESGISTQELTCLSGLSHGALSLRLNQLREYGVLLSQRVGREKCHKLDLDKLGT